MATSLTVNAIGHLTRDPFYKGDESNPGKSVARFTIAHNPMGFKQDGKTELDAIFINVTAFGRTAETVNKYAKKGTQVYVTGRITANNLARDSKTNELVKNKAGEYIINLDMTANEFTLLGSRDDAAKTSSASSASMSSDIDAPF